MPLKQKKELYLQYFMEEFMREMQFVADVIAGRAQPKHEFTKAILDILGPVIKVVTTAAAVAGPYGMAAVAGGRAIIKLANFGHNKIVKADATHLLSIQDAVDPISLKILASKVAREIVLSHEFFIEQRLDATSLRRFASFGVRRALYYLAKERLPLTAENLLLGTIYGKSGAGHQGLTNTGLASCDSDFDGLTVEGAYCRTVFLSADKYYLHKDVAQKNRAKKFSKYGLAIVPTVYQGVFAKAIMQEYRLDASQIAKVIDNFKPEIITIDFATISEYAQQLTSGIRSLREYVRHKYHNDAIQQVIVHGDLSQLVLAGAILDDTDLSNTTLPSNLAGTSFCRAYLQGTVISSPGNCAGANFTGANCAYLTAEGVDLRGANLIRTDFSFANLRGATLALTAAQALDVTLYGASLTDVQTAELQSVIEQKNAELLDVMQKKITEYVLAHNQQLAELRAAQQQTATNVEQLTSKLVVLETTSSELRMQLQTVQQTQREFQREVVQLQARQNILAAEILQVKQLILLQQQQQERKTDIARDFPKLLLFSFYQSFARLHHELQVLLKGDGKLPESIAFTSYHKLLESTEECQKLHEQLKEHHYLIEHYLIDKISTLFEELKQWRKDLKYFTNQGQYLVKIEAQPLQTYRAILKQSTTLLNV